MPTNKTFTDPASVFLSDEERLFLDIENSKTEEEKFIHYIQYAQKVFYQSRPQALENYSMAISTIEEFLDAGMTPDANLGGRPALTYALYCPELLKLLLTRGANPSIKGPFDNTPMHYAALLFGANMPESKRENLATSIELLASFGATIDATNSFSVELRPSTMLARKSLSFSGRFQNLTRHPRPASKIPTTETKRTKQRMQLTEKDRAAIARYKAGAHDAPPEVSASSSQSSGGSHTSPHVSLSILSNQEKRLFAPGLELIQIRCQIFQYLTSGEYPGLDSLAQPLTMYETLEEMKELPKQKLDILLRLFSIGVRGEHLRALKAETEEDLTAKVADLTSLITEEHLSPAEAVARLNAESFNVSP